MFIIHKSISLHSDSDDDFEDVETKFRSPQSSSRKSSKSKKKPTKIVSSDSDTNEVEERAGGKWSLQWVVQIFIKTLQVQ